MEKTKNDVSSEIASLNSELISTLKRIDSLEELDLIQEYISLLNKSENLIRTKKKKELELKEAEMLECNHLFIMTESLKEDELLPGEVTVYCLKCGLTNSHKYIKGNYPSISKMQEITHKTIHNGIFVYDKYITNIDFIKRKYNELKGKMSDEDISKILCEEIRCRINKDSIKKF